MTIKKMLTSACGFFCLLASMLAPAQASNTVAWGSTSMITNINPFIDAGVDSQGVRPGNFGSSYARMLKLSNGTWLATTMIYDNNGYKYSSGGGMRIQVFRSSDNARSWSLAGTIADPGRDLDNPQMVQMPNGDVLLAARSIRWGESYRLYTYRSNNLGSSWLWISTIDQNNGAAGTMNGKGVYEPHMQLLANGNLAVFYANEKHVTQSPSYSQIISQRLSTNGGVTWGSEIYVVWTPGNSASRPGMPVIARMANGVYRLVYEVCGTQNCNMFTKTSNDGQSWASGIGTQIPNQRVAAYIASLSDGRLVVTSNNNVISFSDNYGATWYTNNSVAFGNSTWSALYQTGPSEIAHINSVFRSGGGQNTQVRFGNLNNTTATIVSGAVYKLINPNSGRALDVSASGTANGSNVQIWDDNQGTAQEWRLTKLADGNYKLVNTNSGRALDISASGTANGSNVQIWDDNGSAAQKWRLTDLGDGTVKLVNPNSGRALDISGACTANGSNVQIWDDFNGGIAQKWRLVKK
ncbi:hypothetical protein BH11PSE11_BH11PSE11_21230 [soil metagenome]